MQKPDWKDAPKWANFVAQDDNGDWWWFESKPQLFEGTWWTGRSGLRVEDSWLSTDAVDYKESLEERPA